MAGKKQQWDMLQKTIADCRKCPRLVEYREKVAREKRKAFIDWQYWGRAVPNFGDAGAEFLIVGLAPAAHGANRTGRMFTGDRSGDWLYRALYKAGFATQAEAVSAADGLQLKNCVITATVHCAPPDNKPLLEEILNCRPYLAETMELLPAKVMVALGGIAWKACLDHGKKHRWFASRRPKFGHGEVFQFDNGIYLVGSYHPSQQNTFTGRLTEPMFDEIFKTVNNLLAR
jgi:uracil-DNA glycosylase family 4